jgi:hypothetical protein
LSPPSINQFSPFLLIVNEFDNGMTVRFVASDHNLCAVHNRLLEFLNSAIKSEASSLKTCQPFERRSSDPEPLDGDSCFHFRLTNFRILGWPLWHIQNAAPLGQWSVTAGWNLTVGIERENFR